MPPSHVSYRSRSRRPMFARGASIPLVWLTAAACLATVSCKKTVAPAPASQTPQHAELHIRPHGDETIEPDPARTPADLKKVYDYIDAHIDDHVADFQKWIQQPSISNSGEGIPESAEMVKGFFDKLGCQTTRVYDVGITEYGSPGNPVVYAKCDEGAPKTLVLYWMYDTMPVTQPDAWVAPPFEGRIVDGQTAGIDPAYKKVLVGRGAVNSKGPQLAQLEALMSMRATMGKLPVNIIVVAEGDEERMDIGLRKFVKDHPDLFQGADAMLRFSGQNAGGTASMSGGSEGCVYVELTTSGKNWGKGPDVSDIHGSWKRSVDSPAWRHIVMLSTLVSPDGNTPKIAGFFDNMQPLSPTEDASLRAASSKLDLTTAAKNLGVGRYISDDPYTMLKMSRYGTSFNLDGIWGGNMYAGGAGAILPNKITSKHNFRYIPNMSGLDIVKKLRAQLDKNGYPDVQMKLIGDVPWAKMRYDTDIAAAVAATFDEFGIKYQTPTAEETILGGYWPAYLFSNAAVGQRVAPVEMPIVAGELGMGGRAHAANEYFIIEGAGKVYGLAGAEKSVASMVYNFGHGVKPSGVGAGTMPAPAK